MAYLNDLQTKKQSPRFDRFLTMVHRVGNCPVRLTNNIIGGKWKPVIFNLIVHDVNRFSEILNLVEGLSNKVLTTQLREMDVCSDDTDHLIPGHIDRAIELTLGVQQIL